MKHLMIDLETLGTAPGCIVLSLGAVGFNPLVIHENNMNIESEKWYRNFGIKPQQDLGLTFEAGTFLWWLQQDKAAINALLTKQADIRVGIKSFISFWRRNGYDYIWSHGASFDIPILEHIMRLLGEEPPWKFWNIRDTRTLYDVVGIKPDRSEGTHHNALDDSIQQAKAVQKAYQQIEFNGRLKR